VGTFKDGKAVIRHSGHFTLDRDPTPGDETRVCLPHPELFGIMEKGQRLLINDGKIRLRVIEADESRILCSAEVGGVISDRKGVNVPDAEVPIPALTDKDRKDLTFAVEQGADWIALSFVQRAEDLAEARKLIAAAGGQAVALCAKIEKPMAVNRLADIIEMADGIMVARGDLGVELEPHEVPPLQKKIVNAARRAGKPVIVATQMLESMIESPMPTRAEVSDVATAIYEGADAVMLSAESAAGQYPVEAVTTMDNVATEVEQDPTYTQIIEASRSAERASVADGIVAAAREIAETTDIKAICCFTQSGTTALLVARERPRVPIIALTPLVRTARRLALSWGTNCVITGSMSRFKMAVVAAAKAARAEGFAGPLDQIVVTAGVPFNVPGSTNILRVAPCDERLIFNTDPE
jgi:pyruvate kinase